MAAVARLLTILEITDADDDGPGARRMSVSARHEAVLEDGRHVVLLNDRGWSAEIHGGSDIWAHTTAEELERTARVVVGPDEPYDDRTQADMEAGHWATLARVLQQAGVEVEAAKLMGLPHDVELGDRVLSRIGRL